MMKRLIYILILCLAVSSCESFKVDPAFVSSTTTGLTVKGSTLFTYDPLTCQAAFDRDDCEFRVHTDNMSDYYCLKLNIVPTAEGQKAKGSITWTDKSEVQMKKDVQFEVEKVDRAGRLWLWSKKEGIGALVFTLD